MFVAGAESQEIVAVDGGVNVLPAGVDQDMADGHLRLAGDQRDNLLVVIAIAGFRVIDDLGETGAAFCRSEGTGAVIQRGQRRKACRIVIVSPEDADARFEKTAAHAGLLEPHGGKFLHRAADRTAGCLHIGRLFGCDRGIGHEAIEPVGIVILFLIGDMENHPGMVETGAAIQFVLARRIDLGGDQPVADRHMMEILQRRGGLCSRLCTCRGGGPQQQEGAKKAQGRRAPHSISARYNRKYKSSVWSGRA